MRPTEIKPELPHEAVAQLARQIWEQEGRPVGRDLENWVRAEQQLRARQRDESSRPANSSSKPSLPEARRSSANAVSKNSRPSLL